MQEKIQIISDGSLDLSRELTRERDILVVPFYVSFDGETYLKEGVELDIREFYQRMVDHPDVFPKTSMPSVDDYYQVFLPLAKQDVPMICICITTKFSGSMQSATTARNMILEEYPKARITVIDAEINTVLQGLYVLEACRLRDLGWEYDRMVERLLAIRESGRIFFTIGIIAAAFSSADSALTALTTSFCVDILGVQREEAKRAKRTRLKVHVMISVLFVLIILAFKAVNNRSVIDAIYMIASYTYGPLLGLFVFGLFTKRKPRDKYVPYICIASPLICLATDFLVKQYAGYTFGYEMLMVNGGITFAGLWLSAIENGNLKIEN